MKEPAVERFPSQKNCEALSGRPALWSRVRETATTSFPQGFFRLRFNRLCAAVLWIAAVSAVFGEDVRNFGVTEIVASRELPGERSPGYVEIGESAWEGKPYSTAEILSTLAGVQSYRQGGLGSFETVSIRGIAAREIVVCIDGVPLNDGSGGAVDLGTLDLNQFEKIEIYKDRVPARFGGNGIGGAVNFVTKSAVKKRASEGKSASGRILLAAGSHHFWEGAADVNASASDSLQFSAALSARHSDNDYEFTNRNGTAYNPDDDFTDTRENAQFTEYSGQFKFRLLHDDGAFSTWSATSSRSEGGNPGREDSETRVAGFEGENLQMDYRFESRGFWGGALRFASGISGRFEKSVAHSYYPLDHLGYNSTEYLEYGAAGYRLLPEFSADFAGERLEAGIRLALGADAYESRGFSEGWGLSRFSASLSGDGEFWLLPCLAFGADASAVFVKDELSGGNFVLPTFSGALEDASDRDASGSAMARIRIGKKDARVGGHLGFGRFSRQPQIMELYGVYPGTLSNPDLKAESAVRFEAGGFVSTEGNSSVLRFAYFESRTEDGIFWLVSGDFVRPFNIGETFVRGVEFEFESRPAKFLDVTMRATFQRTEDRTGHPSYDGKMLPGEPARAYFTEARLLLPLRFDVGFSAEYRSKIYTDRANRTEQPAVPRYRAFAGWNPLERTRIVFAVDNISDEKYRNIYSPYPMPGREVKLTLTQGF